MYEFDEDYNYCWHKLEKKIIDREIQPLKTIMK